MPRWYSSLGRTTEDVGHRHAAHGRDADRPRRLLRLGSRTAAAERLRQKAGADERTRAAGHGASRCQAACAAAGSATASTA